MDKKIKEQFGMTLEELQKLRIAGNSAMDILDECSRLLKVPHSQIAEKIKAMQEFIEKNKETLKE